MIIKPTLTYSGFHLCNHFMRIFICEFDSIKLLPLLKLPDSFEQLSKTFGQNCTKIVKTLHLLATVDKYLDIFCGLI